MTLGSYVKIFLVAIDLMKIDLRRAVLQMTKEFNEIYITNH